MPPWERYAQPVQQQNPNVVAPDPMRVQQAQAEEARKQAAEARAQVDQARQGTSLDLSVNSNQRAQQEQGRSYSNDKFDHITKLADRYGSEQTVKEYRIAVTELARALGTGEGPQADLALTYAFAKAMDPGSVVRDTEQAMQSNSQPWFQSKVEQVKKQFGMDGAGTFTPEAREQLRRQVINGVSQRAKLYDSRRDYYSEMAKRNGFDPYEVVGDHDAAPFLPDLQSYDRKTRKDPSAPGSASAIAPPTPWQQDTTGSGPAPKLSSGGDRKTIPIPAEMQQEYEGYVNANRGKLNPEEYAAFRLDLSRKYGFEDQQDGRVYRDEAARINNSVAKGERLNLRIPGIDAAMTGRDQFNASVFNSAPGAALMGAGSMGGAADEVLGTAKALATGGSIDTEIARMDAMRQASANAYPGSSLAGNLAGAGVAAWASGGLLPAASGLPGILGTGAAYGAASGAAENNGNRLTGAAIGAGAGAVGGAIGAKVIAPGIEAASRSRPFRAALEAINGVSNAVTGQGRNLAPVPQYTPQQRVIASVGQDSLAGARNNLNDAARLQVPYALADADPRLRMLGGTVSRKSVDARALAENTFEPRALGQADRATEAIDTYLAPITDVQGRGRDLIEAGNMASRPYYDMAGQVTNPTRPGMEMFYSQPANPDRELTALLNTPTGKQAMNRASRILADRGGDPRSVGLATDANGNTILQDGYSFEALDLVKKGMDDILQEHADPITGKLNLSGKPQAQAIEGLRSRFVERLDATNPTYKEARDTYAPYAQRKEALNRGYEAPSTRLNAREFPDVLANQTPEQLAEFQRGYATKLADTVDTTKLVSDPFKRIYGSTADQQKIDTLFPQAPDFRRVTELERDMSKTAYETLGGSSTAGRIAADDQLTGQLGTMAVDAGSQMMTGGGFSLGSALKAARSVLADSAKLGMGKAAERRATEIAPTLFDTSDPAATAAMLDEITQTAQQIGQRRREASRIGGRYGAVMAPSLLPGW